MEGTIESDSWWKGTSRKELIKAWTEMSKLSELEVNQFDDTVDFRNVSEWEEEKHDTHKTKLSTTMLDFILDFSSYIFILHMRIIEYELYIFLIISILLFQNFLHFQINVNLERYLVQIILNQDYKSILKSMNNLDKNESETPMLGSNRQMISKSEAYDKTVIINSIIYRYLLKVNNIDCMNYRSNSDFSNNP